MYPVSRRVLKKNEPSKIYHLDEAVLLGRDAVVGHHIDLGSSQL